MTVFSDRIIIYDIPELIYQFLSYFDIGFCLTGLTIEEAGEDFKTRVLSLWYSGSAPHCPSSFKISGLIRI